jgi:hypothetical protein
LAGHRGLVEPTPWRHFTAHRFRSLIGRTSRELDLPHTRAAEDFFCATRSEVVIAAAARVGDIPANDVLSSDHERPSSRDGNEISIAESADVAAEVVGYHSLIR